MSLVSLIRDIGIALVLLLIIAALIRRSLRYKWTLPRDMPPKFFDAPGSWSSEKRAREAQIAMQYWDKFRNVVADKYKLTPESTLPLEPPPEFNVEPDAMDPTAIARESRARYWTRLREIWKHEITWKQGYKLQMGWPTRQPAGPREPLNSTRTRRDKVSISPFIAAFMVVVLMLTLAAALSVHPVLKLRPDMPPEFPAPAETKPARSPDQELRVARAYWECVNSTIQPTYGLRYDLPLPSAPPPEFNVSGQGFDNAASNNETRARYWHQLRQVWYLESTWKTIYQWDFSWITKLFQ